MKVKIISIAVVVLLLLSSGIFSVIFIMQGSKESEITVDGSYLKIGGNFGTEVKISEITDVALKDSIPSKVKKKNGFDSGSVMKGEFNVEGLGDGRLYLQVSKGPFIYINTGKDFIIINYEDSSKTTGLYNDILKAWKK